MLLAIDMGNTNIVIGCIDDNQIYFIERLSTSTLKTELEYAVDFKTVLELHNIRAADIDGTIISSVVPQLNLVIKSALEKLISIPPLIVGPG
ncbi:MAG: type III pantothenate kinase, partial [Lachnospiraceae bacterium]|nr:type III pantothenate kinase [Lachnospiraceae bacterium]